MRVDLESLANDLRDRGYEVATTDPLETIWVMGPEHRLIAEVRRSGRAHLYLESGDMPVFDAIHAHIKGATS